METNDDIMAHREYLNAPMIGFTHEELIVRETYWNMHCTDQKFLSECLKYLDECIDDLGIL